MMKRSWKGFACWFCIGLGLFVLLGAMHMIFGDPHIYLNNARLAHALRALTDGSVTLEETVPFEWTAVYTFPPYTSLQQIRQITGSDSPALQESVNEGITHVVFTNEGVVAASVCAYPTDLGYSLSFGGGADTAFSSIEYGDAVVFEVTRENGLVHLYACTDE